MNWDNAFLHVYCGARRKRHGAGKAPVRQAIMLGIMAQYIAWGTPRWLARVMPILMRLLYMRRAK